MEEVFSAQSKKLVDILDFNFDSDLIDGQRAVEQCMRMSVTGPNVAELLFRDRLFEMARHQRRLDVRAGNSVSLKVGAKGSYGTPSFVTIWAAVVVMAFDEQGQAATLEDKVCIWQRSYNLMRSNVDFPCRLQCAVAERCRIQSAIAERRRMHFAAADPCRIRSAAVR